jgi:hypothetical protein
MASVPHALRQVKDDLPQLIESSVNQAVAEQRDWTWRNRLLNPMVLMQLFILQIMHGNTAINHLRHLCSLTFTAAAYCNARKRLPLALVQRVSSWIARDLFHATDDQAPRWRGHRVWCGDATSFSMPDTSALQKHFGQPAGQKPGCGFPVSTMLVLCNAAGFILKTLPCPLRTGEGSQIVHLHDELEPNDVLVYDRAGCSYVHLALLLQRQLHGVLRMHPTKIVRFESDSKHKAQRDPTSKRIKTLGKEDQLVEWFKPDHKPKWMTREQFEALPDSIIVRELRFKVTRKGFRTEQITLATTLLDPREYPLEELAEQYHGRWNIELNFRHLKQTMKMDVLKCKTVDGVLKELAVFTLVYNLVRLVMLRAAQKQKVPLDRISFIDALRWLRAACSRTDRPGIDLIVNPRRPDRVEPRVVKRRPKAYPLMTKPRDKLRNTLKKQGVAP